MTQYKCKGCGLTKDATHFDVSNGYRRLQCLDCRYLQRKATRDSKPVVRKVTAPLAPRVFNNPWEALGMDWRPDWSTNNRYTPAPEQNQYFKI